MLGIQRSITFSDTPVVSCCLEVFAYEGRQNMKLTFHSSDAGPGGDSLLFFRATKNIVRFSHPVFERAMFIHNNAALIDFFYLHACVTKDYLLISILYTVALS